MDYFLKYKKYKKKYIEIKNLYGGFDEYQPLKSNILNDFFDELNYNINLFIQEYQKYNDKLSNYYYFKSLELNKLNNLFVKNLEIDNLIIILNDNYFLNISYFQSYFDIDIYQNLSDNTDKVQNILDTIYNIINNNISDDNILSLKNIDFLQYIDFLMIEIEKLKIQLDTSNITYKEQIISINTNYFNFYKSFTLLLNFIITHTIYSMLHIYYNIKLIYSVNIPYIEDYKINHTKTKHIPISKRSLSNDLHIDKMIIMPTFRHSIEKINDLYKKLFVDEGKISQTFTSRISHKKEFFIERKNYTNDHFTWHKGDSKNYIGNAHYRSASTSIDYKLFFLLDSVNTRTFCFKSVKYNNNLPIYDINDFEYLLFIIYYLKYNFCIDKKNDQYKLSNEYIFFDINKIDIKQYNLLFTT